MVKWLENSSVSPNRIVQVVEKKVTDCAEAIFQGGLGHHVHTLTHDQFNYYVKVCVRLILSRDSY